MNYTFDCTFLCAMSFIFGGICVMAVIFIIDYLHYIEVRDW